MTRDKVFISYSHRDTRWMKRLQKMLKPLIRDGTITLWTDTAIKAGANWRDEIEAALASARVAVLLVSADFLASDFITEEELPHLLRSARDEGMRILWVYLSPCYYEATPIVDFQAAHDVAKPLVELSRPKQDRVLLEISTRIREAVGGSAPELGRNRRISVKGVELEKLSERHEVLPLPERRDGIARVLSVHLGPSTVIGRCYAAQLREAARSSLESLGEHRVHWVLAWDDERLNQIIARLCWRPTPTQNHIEAQNLTAYSLRKQSFAVTAEAGGERLVEAGGKVELPFLPGVALTFTSGVGSGRQQLFRLVADDVDCGDARFPVFHTEATTFLFPPSGGDEATLVRYLGGWIPLEHEALEALVTSSAQPVDIRFPIDDLELRIEAAAGRLWVQSSQLDLERLLAVAKESGATGGG